MCSLVGAQEGPSSAFLSRIFEWSSSGVRAILKGLMAEDACTLPMPWEMASGSQRKAVGGQGEGCAEGRGSAAAAETGLLWYL